MYCFVLSVYIRFVLLRERQLPPATSNAPFIADTRFIHAFDFRVLRQNRRVISGDADRQEELDEFHEVLNDIAWCRETERARRFIVQAYVRGGVVGCAERAELEGSTAVFPKRRYRDRYNRIIVRRVGILDEIVTDFSLCVFIYTFFTEVGKTRNHTLKIKARVRARGARGQERESGESRAHRASER